jgi:hypothetical protein
MPRRRTVSDVGEQANRPRLNPTTSLRRQILRGRNTMNSKLIKASLAGAAALAVAAGGSTFAAWSDFQTVNAGAGAGYLRLNLISDHQGTDTNVIQPFSLAPGQHKTQNFYLASTDSGNTPNGVVTAYIDNLTDTEDTPAGTCTTNSEAIAEGTTNCASNGGELSSQALTNVWMRGPADSPADCGSYDSSIPALVSNQPLLTAAHGVAGAVTLGTLTPGQGVCMVVEVSLPSSATNAVQGDDASWNWHFDLTQV